MKKHNYKIKKTKILIKKLKPFWKEVYELKAEYWAKIAALEERMSAKLKIKDMEIFHCDGEAVGIGNYSRTMPLIQRHELEK